MGRGALGFLALGLITNFASAEPTRILYLSGTDKDNTVLWDFRVSGGRNSGFWTNIPVPSCWETKGFGTYEYGWDNTSEYGEYRRTFTVPSEWAGKRVFLVFEGSMTDTETKVNGVAPGYVAPTNCFNPLPNDRAFDNSAAVPGSSGGVARANGNLNLGTRTRFTLTGWIKSASSLASGFQRLMLIGSTNYDSTSGQSGAYLSVYNSGTNTNALQFKINGDTGNGALSSPNIISGTDWVFFAVTYDSTLGSGNVKFYIGSKTNALAGPVSTVSYSPGASVNFGSAAFAYFLNRNTLNRAFDGCGDDFRIYDGALDQATLEAVRASAVDSNNPSPTNGLLYQWSFNTATSGTTVTPDVGSGGVLTLYNSGNSPADLYTAIGGGVSGSGVGNAGALHQGGFYEFKYEITSNVVFGASTNLLEVKVSKKSANTSVNQAERRADYWVFGGIYRPVYLEAKPFSHIERLAVDAKADGQITVSAFLSGINSNYTLAARVTDSNGVPLGGEFSAPVSPGTTNVVLSASLPTPQQWSAEFPNLYTLNVELRAGALPVHTVTNLIGFRTVTFTNNEGFFINGKKVIMRGVNRHEFWPTSGRTTSRALSVADVELIKSMNANAVRTSHYPPSKAFLEECDRRGLYVLNELAGWQSPYDNTLAPILVREMVIRDVNHPCIIAWANGNEGGHNTTVDHDGPGSTNVYAIYDPQNRKVLRPTTGSSAPFDGVVTYHYAVYEVFTNLLGAGKTVYMPTEIQHALYDGGGGAGFEDHWNAMRLAPNGGGMFIWAFIDEGLVRDDRSGAIDVVGDAAPDGLLGPYREKEASYYTVKKLWSPVQVTAPNPATFHGVLPVENRFDFTDLRQCTFRWQLGWYPDPADPTNALNAGFLVAMDSGNFAGPSVGPGASGSLTLSIPPDWSKYDALRLMAMDPFGRELYTWTWPLHSTTQIANRVLGVRSANAPSIIAGTNSTEIVVTNGSRVFRFSKSNGRLNGVTVSGESVSLSNGPRPATNSWTVNNVSYGFDGPEYVITMNNVTNATDGFEWRLRPDGWLRLLYRYTLTGTQRWFGVTFDYPEANVTAMRWLGQGPYRVWKNRLSGQEVAVYRKTANNTDTGKQWTYPEFRGYHGQLHWATLETTQQPITIVTPTPNLFFRVLTPPVASMSRSGVSPSFPPGNLSFLHAINPIGNKFQPASNTGPQGFDPVATGLYTGEVWFFFGSLRVPGTDRDSNGLSDAWELAYFGALGHDPRADPDGDKLPLLLENAFGLSPVVSDANSPRLPHASAGTVSPVALVYSVPVEALDSFQFVPEISDDLRQWFAADLHPEYFLINATLKGTEKTYTVEPTVAAWAGDTDHLFLRLRIERKN